MLGKIDQTIPAGKDFFVDIFKWAIPILFWVFSNQYTILQHKNVKREPVLWFKLTTFCTSVSSHNYLTQSSFVYTWTRTRKDLSNSTKKLDQFHGCKFMVKNKIASRGGGCLVVSVLAFNLDYLRSNPDEAYSFYSARLFKKDENKRKRGRRWRPQKTESVILNFWAARFFDIFEGNDKIGKVRSEEVHHDEHYIGFGISS